MNRHYKESELLEHYYLPGDSPQTQLHLAECPECAARYASLSSRLRAHSTRDAEAVDKPETFWKRQELSVMQEIEKRRTSFTMRWTHLAAAAALVVVVGGGYWLRSSQPMPATPPASAAITQTAALDTAVTITADEGVTTMQLTGDPWQTESIEDFQSVVDWESWVQKDTNNRGTI